MTFFSIVGCLQFRCTFPAAAAQLQREGHARLPAAEAVRCR